MTDLDKLYPVKSASVGMVKRVEPAKAEEEIRQEIAAQGKTLPGALAGAVEDQEVQQALNKVTNYIQNINRELNFTVDSELDRTIIRVIDQSTGDVVRQIPSEELVELSKSISALKEKTAKGLLFQGDA